MKQNDGSGMLHLVQIHNTYLLVTTFFLFFIIMFRGFNFNSFFNLASSDGVARLWNVSTGAVEREYQGHQKAVTALAFRDEVLPAS